MKSNSDLRHDARLSLKGNWGEVIIALLIYGVIMGLTGERVEQYFDDNQIVSVWYSPFYFLIMGPFYYGYSKFYLEISRNGSAKFETLLDGINHFVKTFMMYLLKAIFVGLWLLLLIVPGIIKAISYSQSYFILIDNPEMSSMDAIDKSMEMMEGHKMQYFSMALYFILLIILSGFLLFIPLFFLIPFMDMSFTKFYEDLKNEQNFSKVS